LPYNLENLHWREFEVLIAYYLKEKVGEGVWASVGSKDKGRDAEFHGIANEFPSKTNPFRGDWIFQVKHRTTKSETVREVQKELLRSLKKELEKIFKKYKFCCDHYVYVTNLNVTNDFRTLATKAFDGFFTGGSAKRLAGPKPTLSVIDYKDLEPYIAANEFVRRAFPALLTFTDLESVFLKREDTKNKGYIRAARRSIDKFVSTHHYSASVKLLADSHLLMLVGDPKSGKTSIVEALAVAFIEAGQCKPYFIRTADEFVSVAAYLQEGERALFICDDIFGQHELEAGKLEDWTNYFQSVMGLVDENHRFVFTTRKYIYEQFANRSGLRAFFPDEADPSRYVIKLSSLKSDEREQILEKHLEHSDLPAAVIAATLRLEDQILGCEDFSPEVIRSLVSLLKGKDTSEVGSIVLAHISHPNQYLYDFFDRITRDKQLLLISVAVAPTKDTTKVESRFLEVLDDCHMPPSGRFEAFIDELDGSIIKKRDYSESSELEYYHPSMYDVIVAICGKDQYYRHLMLRHVNLELLWLLTLRESSPKPNAIEIDPNDFVQLTQGLDSLLTKEATLKDAATVLQWITGSLNIDLAYRISFVQMVNQLKIRTRSGLTTMEFYLSHINEPLEHWTNLFEKMQGIPGRVDLTYKECLKDLHKSTSMANYWRLLFAIEALSPGFIKQQIDPADRERLIRQLTRRVEGLRLGLNFRDGRPKTSETWLSTFYQINELIGKMKKSQEGREIVDGYLLSDWNTVKLHCDFAKHRHSGMVKSGYWKSGPTTKGLALNRLSDSLL
jgi:hypothetical protein